MNKILIGLCQLRKTFLTSADAQSGILANILGDSDDVKVGVITDGLGRALNIQQDGENYIVQVLDQRDDYISDFKTVISGPWEAIKNSFDDLITDQTSITFSDQGDIKSFNIRDFLQRSTSGYELNCVLGSLADKFSTSSKVKVQDLISIVSTYNLSSDYKNQLSNMLATAADADGNISNVNFLQIIKSVTDEGKNSVENGSIALDTTKTRYVDNYLATMVPQLISAIGTLLSALLSAINAIIGIIVAAISWITSAIFGAILGAVPSEVEIIDPLSATDWFEGPSTSREDQLGIPNLRSGDTFSSDFVRLIHEGNFDTCIFLNHSSSGLMWNRFVTLGLDRDKSWERVASLLNVSITRNSGASSTVNFSFKNSVNWDAIAIPDDCYLSDAAREVVLSYSQREISNYLISGFGAYCGFCVMQYMLQNNLNSYSFNLYFDTGNDITWNTTMPDLIQWTADNNNIPLNRLLNFINVWKYVQGSGWHHNFDNDTLTTINLQENALTNGSVMLYASTNLTVGVYTEHYLVGITTALMYCPNNYLTRYIKMRGDELIISNYYIDRSSEALSCIPNTRMFRFAGYSETKLIVVTAISAAVVTAVLVAGSIAYKAFKKHSWKKQMTRKKELMDLKDDYDHGRASLDDLYKAQKSYNFKAKLLGWDQYDAANDWWNAPESSVNPDNTGLKELSKLIAG